MIGGMPQHLGFGPSEARCAIITGDPDRVKAISSVLDATQRVSGKRGYLCYRACIGELQILVVATGIGGPSTAIAVEELVEIGIRVIIRIGTCGALQPDIKVGDLVIPTGCVREDGTTAQYVDQVFPAVPDFEVLSRLVRAAADRQVRAHVGITHCKDAYYLEQAGKQLVPEAVGQRWKIWQRSGVLATEMEASTLFVLGSLRHIRTGGVFVAVGKVTDKAVQRRSVENATAIVADAIVSLVNELGIAGDSTFAIDDSSYLAR